MYRTIRTILRYDTIHTIHTLNRTIHEYLRYADTIQNFLQTIRYVSYDTYRVSYDIDNYAPSYNLKKINKRKIIWIVLYVKFMIVLYVIRLLKTTIMGFRTIINFTCIVRHWKSETYSYLLLQIYQNLSFKLK